MKSTWKGIKSIINLKSTSSNFSKTTSNKNNNTNIELNTYEVANTILPQLLKRPIEISIIRINITRTILKILTQIPSSSNLQTKTKF